MKNISRRGLFALAAGAAALPVVAMLPRENFGTVGATIKWNEFEFAAVDTDAWLPIKNGLTVRQFAAADRFVREFDETMNLTLT